MNNNYIKTLACALLLLSLAVFYPAGSTYAGIEAVNQSLGSGSTAAGGGTDGAGAGGTSSGVVMAGVLNIRSGAWGDIIGTFKQGNKVDIISKEGSWYKVKHNGGEAFVHSAYISTADSPATGGDGYVNTPGSYLNVRTGAWGSIIGRFNHGAAIEILGKQGDWYKVKYNDREAFVHSDYISKTPVRSAAPAAAAASAAPAAASGGNPGAGFGGRPVDGGRITSDYGPRNLFGNNFHHGIDFGVSTGTPLKALGPGTVVSTAYDYGGGKGITIRYDNGYTSVYYHCRDASVSVGQRVSAGQTVGHSNNTGAWTTGPHLHFAMKNSAGQLVNPRSVPGVVI
jgi:uncharacterized protein YgiM (DUF1202 family)